MKFYEILFSTLILSTLFGCEKDDSPGLSLIAHPKIEFSTHPKSFIETFQGPDTSQIWLVPSIYDFDHATTRIRAWDEDSGLKEMIVLIEGNIEVEVTNLNSNLFVEESMIGEVKRYRFYDKSNNKYEHEQGLIDLEITWLGWPESRIEPWDFGGSVSIVAKEWGTSSSYRLSTKLKIVYDVRDIS